MATPDYLEAFDIPPHIRARIAAAGVPCRFRARQVLFRAGDVADGLYFVVAGRVRVSRETRQHVELLHTEGAGGVLGEIPVFGCVPFPATAIALEPTQCVKVPTAAVDRLLREHAEFARYAIRRLATRAQTLLRRIDELTATTVTARVAAHVLTRATDGESFSLGMSQSALASEIGTAREVVVRSLSSLVAAGAIRRLGRSRFALVNRHALEAFVD
jgi:CRP/FNR family cyclic AMP-dependent transcriptional regulator